MLAQTQQWATGVRPLPISLSQWYLNRGIAAAAACSISDHLHPLHSLSLQNSNQPLSAEEERRQKSPAFSMCKWQHGLLGFQSSQGQLLIESCSASCSSCESLALAYHTGAEWGRLLCLSSMSTWHRAAPSRLSSKKLKIPSVYWWTWVNIPCWLTRLINLGSYT